jgi:hypothetical protein
MSGFVTPEGAQAIDTEIYQAIRAGKGYSASMPNLNPGTGGFYAFELFNPASSKGMLVYSILVNSKSYNVVTCLLTSTTEPTLATPQNATIVNLAGGNAGVGNASCKYSTAAGIPGGGTQFQAVECPGDGTMELLSNGAALWLPASVQSGLMLYTYVNANTIFAVAAKYLEL